MSNPNAPFGFAPTTTQNWKRYWVPQSDTTAIEPNDLVMSSGGSDAQGVVGVTLNPGDRPVRGLVVAVEPASPATGRDANLVRLTVPAIKGRDYYVWVLDDPLLEFTARDDGLFPANLIAANVGKSCNFNPNSGGAPGDLSSASLMSSTFATGAIIQVLGLAQVPGNVLGANAIWRCRSRLHELSAEAPGVTFDDLGGPVLVGETRTFIASKWVNKVGYSMLITGASDSARNNNEYNIPQASTYSRDAFGNIQFDCLSFPDADVGRTIKIAHNNAPWLLCLATITSVTDLGNGRTRITAAEQLFGMPPRRAIGAGSVTNATFVCHDMQASPCEMDWVTKLNLRCDGVLTVTNLAMGSSIPSDWVDPELMAYIQGMVAYLGPFDFQTWDGGYGNSLTDPDFSPEELAGQLDQIAQWLLPCARESIFKGNAGGRPGGDDNPVPNPWLLPDYTTQQRLDKWLRAFASRRWQTCEYADMEVPFQRFSLRGSVDTPDMVAGLISNRLKDQGGIHEANAGCDVTADVLADIILPKLTKYRPGSSGRNDLVYINTTPDNGGRYNPSGAVGWYGACATAPVNIPGLGVIGTGFAHLEVTGSGFNHNMTAAISVENGEAQGRKMRLVFMDQDPASQGGVFLQLKITAVEFNGQVYPFAQFMNDPKFSGPCHIWLDWGVYGFLPDSMLEIEAGLFGTTASGTREVASFMASKGSDTWFATQRAWTDGFDGMMKAGNRAVIIPQREVYTEGALIIKITGSNIPMEQCVIEVRDFRVQAEQLLL